MNENIIEKIKKLVLKYPCSYSTIIKYGKQYENILNYINEYTCHMPDDIPLPARIFYTITNTKEIAKCKVCGKDIPHKRKCNALTGYSSMCCSHSCAQLDPDHKKKQEELSFAKYGTKCPQMSDIVKTKMKKTLSKKQKSFWENANKKRKDTNIKKYGVESVSQIDKIRNQKHDTMCNKSIDEMNDRLNKTKQTKLIRYGNENFVNIEKIKNTIQENINSNNNYWKDISEKRKATNIKKYGVDHPLKLQYIKDKIKKSHFIKSFNDYISKSEYVKPLFNAEYYAEHRHELLNWQCKECGNIFSAEVGDQMYFPARCLKCHPLHEPVSRPEKEIVEFIKTIYNGEIIENNRTLIKPNEIDIYLPEKNIAFELNGLLWHSEEMGTTSTYHLSKTERCENLGVQLIHITEAEWKCKDNIVKSRIKNLLGIYDKTIFARKCKIKIVDNKTSKEFQDENHIQGYTVSKINIGLYFEDELISLMTFGKCRFNKKYEWELLRFCNKLGYHIPGAASKLLKYFEKNYNPKSLISYADRRWSQGKLYNALGFSLDHISKPDYKYWNRKKGVYMPESRIKYQKHKLKDLIENFDPNISESKNMRNAGFLKIYDCGNLVYIKLC